MYECECEVLIFFSMWCVVVLTVTISGP